MDELNKINNDIYQKRIEQRKIKEDICNNILNTYKFYNIHKKGFVKYNIKIDNYKFKSNNSMYRLYVDNKCILEFEKHYTNKYRYMQVKLNVSFFDNSAILEMQDFNDKLVEEIKIKLLSIKEKEEDEAIKMIALKSLI